MVASYLVISLKSALSAMVPDLFNQMSSIPENPARLTKVCFARSSARVTSLRIDPMENPESKASPNTQFGKFTLLTPLRPEPALPPLKQAICCNACGFAHAHRFGHKSKVCGAQHISGNPGRVPRA